MNRAQIENLRLIINLLYPHICVHEDDLSQFINSPWEAARFYPFYGRGDWYHKKGFFHNGKTTVWATRAMKQNHVKIADREVPTEPTGARWSDAFSFEKEGAARVIQRMMKLKAFW